MKTALHIAAFLLAFCSSGCEHAAAGGDNSATPAVVETGECGARGQRDCPTQRWMKATLQSYLRGGDFERLAAALDTLAAKQPAEFGGWRDIALKGAAAARAHDEITVRASCKSCHEEFRDRFKASLRQQVLFGS